MKTSDYFDFAEALRRLKLGKWVRPPGRTTHIYLEGEVEFRLPGGAFRGQTRRYAPALYEVGADGVHQPWLPAMWELLATNWTEVEPA